MWGAFHVLIICFPILLNHVSWNMPFLCFLKPIYWPNYEFDNDLLSIDSDHLGCMLHYLSRFLQYTQTKQKVTLLWGTEQTIQRHPESPNKELALTLIVEALLLIALLGIIIFLLTQLLQKFSIGEATLSVSYKNEKLSCL